jgi:hypothetical protein
VARKTLAEFGVERLAALCEAVEPDADFECFIETFRRLVEPWASHGIADRPRYSSHIADDEVPYEFGAAFSAAAPEVQAYVDPHAEPPSLRANMNACRALLGTIAGELGVPLDRMHRVAHIFLPDAPCGRFALWIGLSWSRGHPLRLKAYLNPQVRGQNQAFGVMAETMRHLDFKRAWSRVHEALAARGDRRDELAIVSLDLSSAKSARVKVYIRRHHATVDDLDRLSKLALDHRPGDAAVFYGALARSPGPFVKRPAITELAFVDPNSDRPSSSTLEFPIGSYVESDEEARRRVGHCLAAFDLPSTAYDRAVHGFATRPLDLRTGLHAHVTFRRIANAPRIAVYFASEAYDALQR